MLPGEIIGAYYEKFLKILNTLREHNANFLVLNQVLYIGTAVLYLNGYFSRRYAAVRCVLCHISHSSYFDVSIHLASNLPQLVNICPAAKTIRMLELNFRCVPF
jgi:hypothetical protein